MKFIRTLTILLVGVPLLWTSGASAASVMFEFNSNDSVLETRLGGEFPLRANTLRAGVGTLYGSDDYFLFSLDASAGNMVWGPDAFFYMGLKGFFGLLELRPKDADIMGVAFLLGGEFEPYRIGNLPVVFDGHVAGALGPMNFGDNDGFLEFRTTAGLDFLADRRGGFFVGYRYLHFGLDDDFSQGGVSKNEVFLGLRFRY